jgi:predicted transcriptional regulator
MHTQTNPGESEEFARLDGAILGLLVTPYNPRPWSEDEIARAITLPGDVHDAVKRLHKVGLVHRWHMLVSATAAAVRSEEIAQEPDDNSLLAADRRMEGEVLHILLRTRNVMPMSEKDIRRALRIKKKDKLGVLDALNRLRTAGLVDRPGGLAVASDAAVRLDAIDLP